MLVSFANEQGRMAPQWTAERTIDKTRATALIASQCPELAGLCVEPMGEGWDNTAFLIGDRYVFRFPRRTIAVELIEREAALLPLIAPLLPIAIPEPCFVGAPSESYPWPFAGYPFLAGTTACRVSFTDDERQALASSLGRFLRALHEIDSRPLRERGLPRDTIGRLDHRRRMPAARERYAKLHATGLIDDPAPLLAFMEAVAPRASDDRACVVHGDLYARHLLIERDRRLSGVIDWGDLHYGHPALDLAIAYLMLPPQARDVFRSAYGAVDERTWQLARYRAGYHVAYTLEYAVALGDRALLRASTTAYRYLLSE